MTPGECLARLHARAPTRIRILTLERNQGKAEAVRHGMLAALEEGAGDRRILRRGSGHTSPGARSPDERDEQD